MKKIAIVLTLVFLLGIMTPLTSFATTTSDPRIPPNGLEAQVQKYEEINKETVGWLYIPDTNIDDVVMQGTDNKYYWNHDFKKQESAGGSYMADYRCNLTPGYMPKNTVIYGKSLSDDLNGENFNQIKKYVDDDFAKAHPFIYYSDGKNTYTFQVFAVFVTNISLPYNVPNLEEDKLNEVLKTAKELSIREYKSQPSSTATLLTLSCDVYDTINTEPTYFPRDYRFVVMAKAVQNPYKS